MKKLLVLILDLLMLCGCSSEPEEIERKLGCEPERGIIESGIAYNRGGEDYEYIEFESSDTLASNRSLKKIFPKFDKVFVSK